MSKAKHIGFFGRRNSGKSSLINLLSGEEVAIVSDRPGTTTDPVKKRMELPGIGPVILIDTAGIDDSGKLGMERVNRSRQIISQIDLAVLIYTGNSFDKPERDLANRFKREAIPFIMLHNQSDIVPMDTTLSNELSAEYGCKVIEFSCAVMDNDEERELLDRLIQLFRSEIATYLKRGMFDNLIKSGDRVLLVVTIDEGAPEGRLILPQVNAIREILDLAAIPTVIQVAQLEEYIELYGRDLSLVVTDSQIFDMVARVVPAYIPLTGFSILLAYSKSNFDKYLEGTPHIDKLKDGDRVLILESCSHHSSCDDIGRVKIPALLRKHTGNIIEFDVIAGLDMIKRDLKEYALIVQCGGCMITQRQLYMRLREPIDMGIPVTNYGMTIAWCMGIYDRAMEPILRVNR